MRTLFASTLLLSASALWAADPAQPAAPAAAPEPAPAPAPAEPAAPPEPAPKLTPEQEKQVFMAQGYVMAHNMGLSGMVKELQMDRAEIAALARGIELALGGEQLPFDFQSLVPGAQAFFGERAAASAKLREAANKEWADTNAAFLAKVDTDTAVTKTASGLRYQIIAAGSAEKPVATNTVKVRYTGKLCNGQVFDTTDERGGEPVEFRLDGVIKGWTEGVQLIGKGGKIRLWVPADLGYGARESGPIPSGSALEFEVELVDFK